MNGHRSVHGETKTARNTSWKVSRTNQLQISKMENTKCHHIRVNGSVYKHCNCCTRISIYGCGCIWLVANRTNSRVKVVHRNNFRWVLVEACGNCECCVKTCYNVPCGVLESYESLVWVQWQGRCGHLRLCELADPCNAAINAVKLLNCAISLCNEWLGSCFSPTGLLSIKLCHQ